MAGQKNYFGKGNIRPTLPGVKKPDNPADPNLIARESLRTAEKSASGLEHHSLYHPTSTKSKSNKFHPTRQKKPLRARLRKVAPALLIVGVLLGGALLIFGSSSFLGPHLESLFTEATNTEYTAYTLRSNEIFKEILDGKLEMTDYLKERLENEGIKVNGNSLEYDGISINSENFDAIYNGNVHFREALTYARRGRIATFFDSAAQEFYKKLGLSRDVFHDYNVTGDQATDDANYDELMTNYFSGGSDMTIDTAEKEITTDENGNEIINYIATGEAINSTASGGESAEDRAKAYLDSVGNKVAANTPGCAALEIGNMVATAVANNERYASSHDFMTKMESLSKSREGSGDSSAVNSVLNWFTKSATSSVYDAVTGEQYEVTGAPLEAEGMRVVLGGLTANRSNAKKYSIERSYESTNASIANAGLSTATCNIERATSTLISLSALAVPGGPLVKATIGILLDVGLKIGVKITASTVLSLLVPTVAQVMYSNPYENAIGISGGEYFAEGASNINTLAAQQNSGATGATRERVIAYNKANAELIAQEAEIDRAKYSPFDASQKHTFLGSILNSLLPLTTFVSNISSSPISTLSTLSSITNTALTSLSTSYAGGENTSLMTNFADYCEKIGEIGAAGNIYCTMSATHDLSTIDVPEDDEMYRSVIEQSVIEEDGKEIIIDGSPLSHFINYWMGRYSNPGIYDVNIANACENSTIHVPLLSNIVEMVKSLGSDYCRSVADGSRYVNSPDNPAWEETEKWHQLYVLSARIKKNLGMYGEADDPVTAYRKNYEAKHPLDNSRAGYLARISGISKEDAKTVLAVVDYEQRIANYNPATRYNFTKKETAQALNYNSENLQPVATAILLKDIKYIYPKQEITL